MKNKIVLKVLLLFSFIFSGLFSSFDLLPEDKNSERDKVYVTIDPRVELMSIIFRLAGNPEYTQGRIPSYIADIDKYFGLHRNHPAVELAKKLRETQGVSFDAVMKMAVHITDAVSLKEKVPFDPYPEGLDERWTLKGAYEFLDSARNFVKDTNFMDFFNQHRSLYDLAVSRMQEVLEKSKLITWANSFFGERTGFHFTIILGMVNGGPSYGAYVKNSDGTVEIYSIPGVWMTDAQGLPRFDKTVLTLVMHEFIHSFTNPLVQKYKEALKAAGERIYPYVAKTMEKQAYGNWQTMMYESLVRACVLRYLSTTGGDEAAEKQTKMDKKNGFLWIGNLRHLLGDYEAQRQKYSNLDAFFPRIIEFFNEYAKEIDKYVAEYNNEVAKKFDALRVKAPKVISIEPSNGAENVEPSLKFIRITFDRPMKDKQWAVIRLGDQTHFPKIIGSVGYDAEHKVFTIPVELQPDWTYEFGLNNEDYLAFQSEGGDPLLPIVVKFKTKKIF